MSWACVALGPGMFVTSRQDFPWQPHRWQNWALLSLMRPLWRLLLLWGHCIHLAFASGSSLLVRFSLKLGWAILSNIEPARWNYSSNLSGHKAQVGSKRWCQHASGSVPHSSRVFQGVLVVIGCSFVAFQTCKVDVNSVLGPLGIPKPHRTEIIRIFL